MGKAKTAPVTGLAKTKKESALDRIRENAIINAAEAAKDLSFEELLASIPADQLISASEIGDGYHLLRGDDDKRRLVGVPFIITDWDWHPGSYGQFVTMRVKTRNPVTIDGQDYDMFIVNDGSTGIARQLEDWGKNEGRSGLILAKRGLRASDYDVMEDVIDNDTGKVIKKPVLDPATGKGISATTFYLDLSV
jgi:hypothetical protein